MVAEQREDRGAAARGLVEEGLGAVPAGGGCVDLVAAADTLDHDRYAALPADLDQQRLVARVEATDHALRQVGDAARPGPSRLFDQRE